MSYSCFPIPNTWGTFEKLSGGDVGWYFSILPSCLRLRLRLTRHTMRMMRAISPAPETKAMTNTISLTSGKQTKTSITKYTQVERNNKNKHIVCKLQVYYSEHQKHRAYITNLALQQASNRVESLCSYQVFLPYKSTWPNRGWKGIRWLLLCIEICDIMIILAYYRDIWHMNLHDQIEAGREIDWLCLCIEISDIRIKG